MLDDKIVKIDVSSGVQRRLSWSLSMSDCCNGETASDETIKPGGAFDLIDHHGSRVRSKLSGKIHAGLLRLHSLPRGVPSHVGAAVERAEPIGEPVGAASIGRSAAVSKRRPRARQCTRYEGVS